MISERISNDIPPQMKILNSNALLQSRLKLDHCKPHKAARHQMKCDVINDVKLFPTVYRIAGYIVANFLTLSNQTLYYKSKCIRTSNRWNNALYQNCSNGSPQLNKMAL